MEFLRFIFSGFWVFCGFMTLVLLLIGGIVDLVKACKRRLPRKMRWTDYPDGTRIVEVEGADEIDIKAALDTQNLRRGKGLREGKAGDRL